MQGEGAPLRVPDPLRLGEPLPEGDTVQERVPTALREAELGTLGLGVEEGERVGLAPLPLGEGVPEALLQAEAEALAQRLGEAVALPEPLPRGEAESLASQLRAAAEEAVALAQ